MTILIRAARAADVEAISTILIASITQLCADDHHGDPQAIAAWTRNKNIEGVAAMLADGERILMVAERAGAVVAVGAVIRSGEIALNYVAPEARFSGVSKALLAGLEQRLRALGFEEGRLESTATARRFYEAAGWSNDGPQARGRHVNGYPMRKDLS